MNIEEGNNVHSYSGCFQMFCDVCRRAILPVRDLDMRPNVLQNNQVMSEPKRVDQTRWDKISIFIIHFLNFEGLSVIKT